jgi:uncharacterized protein YqgC (DUF456 family)
MTTDLSSGTGPFLSGITLVVMIVALLGLIIPILPGLVIIWAAALGYGILAGFDTLGWTMFAILSMLMIPGELAEHFLLGMLVRKDGVPWGVIIIVLAGAIAGSVIVPIFGGILAGLLVLFGIEWFRSKDVKKALASLRGLLVGFALGFAARFIAGLMMVGSWCVAAFA